MKKQIFYLILTCMLSQVSFADQSVIFGVSQDLPMGEENEVIKKNYYVNLGKNQGVYKGTTLDVFRVITVVHPHKTKEKSNFEVKLGQLKIVHSEDNRAVGILKALIPIKDSPQFDRYDFGIGDVVAVKIR